MDNLKHSNSFEKDAILGDVLRILDDLTSDWEMEFAGKLGPETHLVADLAFASIDVVQLAVAIEEHFKRTRLPFQKLFMTNDREYVEDLQVSELVNFLYLSLNSA
jgi:acyl carrier protein